MPIDDVQFERLDPATPTYVMRVTIRMTDFQPGARPLVAALADQPVHGLIQLVSGDGLQGLLAAEPPAGAELRIGYVGEQLFDTGFSYQPPIT